MKSLTLEFRCSSSSSFPLFFCFFNSVTKTNYCLLIGQKKGLEALKDHFKNSKFPCELEHYLPVVFSPPRDGKQLSEPVPIVGQKQHITSGSSSKATDDDDDDDDDYDYDIETAGGSEEASIADSANHHSGESDPVD